MKVKLIQMTEDPISIMWTAARTCYSEKSPIEMWDNRYKDSYGEPDMDLSNQVFNEKQEKMWNLVKQVLDSGHLSIAEHVYFTFAIEGISRSCSHQLVRHRHCTFSQQSQRYVEIKENLNRLEDIFLILTPGSDYNLEEMDRAERELLPILNKYFVSVTEDNYNEYIQILRNYLYKVKLGMKPEDARMVLPNATKTNLVMSCNLRELIHICNLRLCNRAQLEIRELFKEIKKQVTRKNEYIGNLLVPNCEKLNYCPEQHKSCGRKPKLSDLISNK